MISFLYTTHFSQKLARTYADSEKYQSCGSGIGDGEKIPIWIQKWGSGKNIPDDFSESLETVLVLKILKIFLTRNPG